MTDEDKEKYEISDAGEVLGRMIWSNMVDNFATRKPLYSYNDCFIECLSESNNPNLTSRYDNVKSYIAIRDAVSDYVKNYSYMSAYTIGTAKASAPSSLIINIDEDSEFLMEGILDLDNRRLLSDKSDEIFMAYSIPSIFGQPINSEDYVMYVSNISSFYDIIFDWLSFPFINISLYGADRGLYVTGKGKVRFGVDSSGRSKKDIRASIISDVESNMQSAIQIQTNIPNYELFWCIIATGIVKYLNYNEVITTDVGMGEADYLLPPTYISSSTSVLSYTGSSSGHIEFGSDMVSGISTTILGLDFIIPLKLNIPPICFTKDIIDEYGHSKTIRVCLTLDLIVGTLSDIISNVSMGISNAINITLDKLMKILNGVLTTVDDIKQIISDAFIWFMSKVNIITEAIQIKLVEFITRIRDMKVFEMIRKVKCKLMNNLMYILQSNPITATLSIAFVETQELLINFRSVVTSSMIIIKVRELLDKLNNILSDMVVFIDTIINKLIDIIGRIGMSSDCCPASIVYMISDDLKNINNEISNIDDDYDIIVIPEEPEQPDDFDITELTDDEISEMNKLGLFLPNDNIDSIDDVPSIILEPATELVDILFETIRIPDIPIPEIINPVDNINIYKTIILDPGHGGIIDNKYQTEGKRTPEPWLNGVGIYEGVYNREVVSRVKTRLEQLGIPVLDVVDSQYDISLRDRINTTKNYDYDIHDAIYISIHSNAIDTSVSATGIEAYIRSSYDIHTYKKSMKLMEEYYCNAYYIAMDIYMPEIRCRYGIDTTLGFLGKRKDYYVLKNNPIPAILIENFFMTTYNDCKNYLMTNSVGFNSTIEAIVSMIDEIARYR